MSPDVNKSTVFDRIVVDQDSDALVVEFPSGQSFEVLHVTHRGARYDDAVEGDFTAATVGILLSDYESRHAPRSGSTGRRRARTSNATARSAFGTCRDKW